MMHTDPCTCPFSDTWFSCSTQQDAVGCVWTWFVDSSTTSQDTRPTPSATTSLVFDASSTVSASDASATASQDLDDHEPTGTTSSLYATAASTTASDKDNQVDDGDDDDENSSLTSSSIRSTTSHDATITSSATFSIPTAQDTVTSQIGDGLWAGHKSGTRQGGKTSFASDASGE